MDVLEFLLNNLLTNRHLIVLVLSFYLLMYLTIRRGVAWGASADRLWAIAFWIGVGGLIGGRLGYIFPNLGQYLQDPLLLIRVNFGLTFYGGILGGALGAWWGACRAGVSVRDITIYMAPFLPLALAIDRFGCLVGPGSCVGKTVAAPLGIVFPGATLARYPSHIYEGLLALIVVGLVVLAERKGLRPAYAPFLIGLGGYGLGRSLVDLTRIGWPGAWIQVDFALGIALALAAAGVIMMHRYAPQMTGVLTRRPSNPYAIQAHRARAPRRRSRGPRAQPKETRPGNGSGQDVERG